MILSQDFYLCLNYGFHSEPITLSLQTNLWFKDCYKDLIDTFLDVRSTLFSENSRLIDKCTDSIDSDITILEYKPITTEQDFYMYGDGKKTSCFPGYIRSYIPLAVLHYIAKNYFEGDDFLY